MWPQLFHSETMQNAVGATEQLCEVSTQKNVFIRFQMYELFRMTVYGPTFCRAQICATDPKMTSISYLIRNDIQVFWCSVDVCEKLIDYSNFIGIYWNMAR